MLVVIESPYAGDIERNVRYARDAVRDCFDRGETPFASHLMYPGALDDDDPIERERGIDAGIQWGMRAERVVAYVDLGVSPGMARSIALWKQMMMPVEERRISGWDTQTS